MLREIYHAFPTRTPNRLQQILQCLSCQSWDEDGKNVIIDVNDDFSRTSFSPSYVEHVVSLDHYFGPPESHQTKEFSAPIILVPKILFCCEKAIIIDSRASEITIYTNTGVQKTKSFHGCCKKCSKTYYCGFMHNKKLNIR